ncbi:MAG TPA: hypothetical protein VF821_25295, partial [Lentzea sp.]
MSVWTITDTTAGTLSSRSGSHLASACATGNRPQLWRSIPADRSTPTGVQPSSRTVAACTPVPQPISRHTPPPRPSSSRSARPIPSGSSW